ncbi:MAG: hypothetical protein ACOWWO_19875 [Peptococcaceae bacterium]
MLSILKIKLLLGISLFAAFLLINVLADVMYKDDPGLSSIQYPTPYGVVYNK